MRPTIRNFFPCLVLALAAPAAWATCAPSEDVPDAAFIDANCDGIDGDIGKSFFVAPGGSDANAGTMAAPFATIGRGISAAAAHATRKHVLVAAGTYPESVAVPSGVSLFGLYEPTLWRRSPLNITTIASPSPTALVVDGYAGDGYIEGFQLISANASATGASSYGARIGNVTGSLRFRYNVLRPGNGTAGGNGFRGSDGGAGGNAGNGEPGCEHSTFPCGICTRPLAGFAGSSPLADRWGSRGGYPGLGGGIGETAPNAGYFTTDGRGMGGIGGRGGGGGTGGDGGDGNDGVRGANGAGGAPTIILSGTSYQPSSGARGGDGTHGSGGGGGGGGGGGDDGCDSYGSGGGGGGGGGQAGTGGTGGGGGGASLGLVIASSGAGLTIAYNTMQPRAGGGGGQAGGGGFGGIGGKGGGTTYGGSGEQDDGGMGGAGGWGGSGGHGGHGGGGGGGASAGIAHQGVSGMVFGNTVDLSLSVPGAGGYSPGSYGSTGAKTASTIANNPAVPTPPVNVAATASPRAAQVSFRAPLSNGASPVNAYRVTADPGGASATGSASPISVTGLANNTPYTFTVVATNAVGTSAASAASNLVVPRARVELDLDGDGRSDLLWHNRVTGQVYRMLMEGTAIESGAQVYLEPDTAWSIVADGDFNRDGVADLLWRHGSSGQLYQMTFNAQGQVSGGIVFYAEPNAAWKIVQSPDLDGDGASDLVWWNSSTGQVYYMLLDGPSIRQQGFIYHEPDTAWRIVASGDFAGSGRQSQLLWHNATTGSLYLMTLNVAGIAGQPPVSGEMFYREPNVGWKVVGAADFDGDGRSDILWRNGTTGEVWMMLMNGGSIAAQGRLHVEPDPAWRIAALGDYDGDGRADVAWFNEATGQVHVMLVNGIAIASQATVYQEPNPDWDLLARPGYGG